MVDKIQKTIKKIFFNEKINYIQKLICNIIKNLKLVY